MYFNRIEVDDTGVRVDMLDHSVRLGDGAGLVVPRHREPVFGCDRFGQDQLQVKPFSDADAGVREWLSDVEGVRRERG